MAYNRINWENGNIVNEGYVIIDGVRYPVVQPEYEGNTPINEDNLNAMDLGIFENAVFINDVLSNEGNIKIGNIGIEWGVTSITSSSTAASSTPFARYMGETSVSFDNTYAYAPGVIAAFSANYNNQLSCYARNATTTATTIGAYLLGAESTRNIKYLVIGVLSDDD